MIPCIEDKCLKFPICKSKVVIDCISLKQFYLNHFDPEAQILDESSRIWSIIHKHLPYVSVINPGTTTELSYTPTHIQEI